MCCGGVVVEPPASPNLKEALYCWSVIVLMNEAAGGRSFIPRDIAKIRYASLLGTRDTAKIRYASFLGNPRDIAKIRYASLLGTRDIAKIRYASLLGTRDIAKIRYASLLGTRDIAKIRYASSLGTLLKSGQVCFIARDSGHC